MKLDEIEKRAREAIDLASQCSAGPWHIGHIDENLDHAEIEDAEGGLIGEIYPRGAQSLIVRSRMLVPAIAADVLALVEEVRLAREWLSDEEASAESLLCSYRDEIDEIAIASRKEYRAFLAKREAP